MSKLRVRRKQPKKGRRYTSEEKEHALQLVASGMTRQKVHEKVGVSVEGLRLWVDAAQEDGTMPEAPMSELPIEDSARSEARGDSKSKGKSGTGKDKGDTSQLSTSSQRDGNSDGSKVASPKERSLYAPKDPGQGLSALETSEILKIKKKNPSMGPAQIRAQLKRFKGWRIGNKVIGRVLRDNGYDLVHRGSRPWGPEPIRFEAPRRNALWQMDYTELRVGAERFHALVILDDFSRYCVGHTLGDSPSSEVAITLLKQAIARHGVPEAIRTDRGGAFKANSFGKALEAELIDHIVGRAYHPQGGGKVESLIGTLRRELWDVEQFGSRDEAARRMAEFFEHYNERRAHMGIDGLTPADRFFGRADRVLDTINAISRRRNGALERLSPDDCTFEEVTGQRSGSPMEVLRLVLVDGRMQLRFCGAQVDLGPLRV